MPMEITVTAEAQGSSTKLKISVLCIGKNNEKYSGGGISINGLVALRYHCIQNFQYESTMKALIGVRKIVPCYVVAMIWAHTGKSSETICSNEESWELIGEKKYSVKHTDFSRNVSTYTFEFSVSVYAYKVEHMTNEKLYNDTEFTDFSLSTVEGSVPIHKAHLAAHSDVFRAMLNREWKETKEGRINMEGVTLKTLQQLKDYMYLGTLPRVCDDVLPLWSIASCYFIEDLEAKCLLKFPEIITPENFYSMLEYSIENKMTELTFAILKGTPEKVVLDAEKLNKEKKVIEKIEKEKFDFCTS